ncbi:MAG: helix-turn-helix transcriptional regulator [Planctomycetales bacterium]|nr:helix-turn-helix transcriptional regulator [Planctomycetales bacterium]
MPTPGADGTLRVVGGEDCELTQRSVASCPNAESFLSTAAHFALAPTCCADTPSSVHKCTELDIAAVRRDAPNVANGSISKSPSPLICNLKRKLHRVAKVRVEQNVSHRTIARRMGIEVRQLKELEQPETDLTMSQLMAFQQALDVPMIDLLEDRTELSRPVQERAKLVRIMKTASALKSAKASPRINRLASMLCEQLVDLMPELAEVSGWPQFGARRGQSALGKALQNPISVDVLDHHD